MEWDKEARARLGDAPALLRGFIARKVEEVARAQGSDRVTLAIWDAAKRLRDKALHDPSSPTDLPSPELLSALVRETENRGQREGKAFRLRVCGGAFGCPRPQVDVAGLAQELEAELERSGLAERLDAALAGRVLTHHKLAVAVAGCVNGCSEPPTKDFGVSGQARPEAVKGKCTGCRRCEKACQERAVTAGRPGSETPDPSFDRAACLNCGDCARACQAGAIALTPGYRVTIGGRLGRHPRLASVLIPFTEDRQEVVQALRELLAWAQEVGRPGERIAALLERCPLPGSLACQIPAPAPRILQCPGLARTVK
ncbi:MAG: 4Fe-4S dicluster domain-containing protein [Chitinophagales bacterium]